MQHENTKEARTTRSMMEGNSIMCQRVSSLFDHKYEFGGGVVVDESDIDMQLSLGNILLLLFWVVCGLWKTGVILCVRKSRWNF
jgi:hypothetical protein